MAKPELLAPAGSPEALVAAVQSGADAIYFGYGDFNARRNAKNFSSEDLKDALSYCHLRGVQVYLTLNTLVTDRELPQVAETAAFAAACGVDAFIVQDLGVLRLLRETVPEVPLHGSTQMTIHNLRGLLFCEGLGISRVVLSRELSREAIAYLSERSPIELEVFAHGALCMSYSGQCYFSSLVGGRSGNRGLCAQPCRLPYRYEEGGYLSYPLSLKDLSLADHLEEVGAMGVSCLKLEGRMKRPEYVAIVTKLYADALREGRKLRKEEQEELAAAFSREGFTQGYYLAKKGPSMFGRRKEAEKPPEALFSKARESYAKERGQFVPIRLTARIEAEKPMELTVMDEDGNVVSQQGPVPEGAKTRPLTEEQVKTQLSKTGGTVFSCQSVEVFLEEGLSLPVSAMNALRRQCLEALSALRSSPPERTILPFVPRQRQENPKGKPVLTLTLRRFSQLSSALLEDGPALLYLPSEELFSHQEQMRAYIAAYPTVLFGVQLPTIVWDRELPLLTEQLSACRSLGIEDALIGSWGLVSLCQELGFRLRGDYGLGVTNSLTMEELGRQGFSSATASFELNFPQVRDLSKVIDTELFVYGRLSMMLTEHCLTHNRDNACHCQSPSLLIDRKGLAFPILPAFGCRSEVMNANTLYLADKQGDYEKLGLWAARLSFTTESPEDCCVILRSYQGKGEAPPANITRGLYYRKVE